MWSHKSVLVVCISRYNNHQISIVEENRWSEFQWFCQFLSEIAQSTHKRTQKQCLKNTSKSLPCTRGAVKPFTLHIPSHPPPHTHTHPPPTHTHTQRVAPHLPIIFELCTKKKSRVKKCPICLVLWYRFSLLATTVVAKCHFQNLKKRKTRRTVMGKNKIKMNVDLSLQPGEFFFSKKLRFRDFW